jgi:Na+/H+ antiporter NhaD/arsenite permease-like protein
MILFDSLLWIGPFIATLIALILGPLLSHHWHRKQWFVLGGITLIFIIMSNFVYGINAIMPEIFKTIFNDYIPFIILISSLYCIGTTVKIEVQGKATTLNYMLCLIGGSIFALFIGTTGAAILTFKALISLTPIYEQHFHEKQLKWALVILIITVANIAGAGSTLGDAPLFAGYLYGVPFFWPILHLGLPSWIMIFIIIGGFSILSFFSTRHWTKISQNNLISYPLSIQFFWSWAWIGWMIMLLSLSVPFWCPWHWVREFMLLGVIIGLFYQDKHHTLSLDPIYELMVVFGALMITSIPMEHILNQGANGPFASIFMNTESQTINSAQKYFWISGLLSTCVDNTPTYLMLLKSSGWSINAASGLQKILEGISAGAVFMGGLTYIGNSPNLIIRQLALQNGIFLPNFLLYTFLAFIILFPLFIAYSWIFLG